MDGTSGGGVLGGGDRLGRSLERWLADALVDEAAQRRLRERWLQIQSEEEASFVGTLLDLAERRRPVTIDVGDQRFRGVLAGIGADFVALRTDRGQHAIVRTDAVDAVRSEPGGVDVRGERSVALEVTLAGVMGPIAADRPDVLVRTRSGVTVRGQLRSAGTDVLRLRVDGDPPTPTWLALDRVGMLLVEP
jgi:hypothetical protein